MDYYCITDIGLLREKNQDSYLALYNEHGDFLALVADGIGGERPEKSQAERRSSTLNSLLGNPDLFRHWKM